MLVSNIKELAPLVELTDVLAPDDPKKLYQAVLNKAVGWAVNDALFVGATYTNVVSVQYKTTHLK